MRVAVAFLLAASLFGCASSPSTKPADQSSAAQERQAATKLIESQQINKPIQTAEDWTRALVSEISKEWTRPPNLKAGLTCIVRVTLKRDGTVGSSILEKPCGGTEFLNMMLVAAVFRASPLTVPEDDTLFSPTVVLEFRPK
jgi:Flp pilus assembly protein TadD